MRDCGHGKASKSVGQRAKSGRFVIGSTAFAKISAVEGISLTDAMKKRADDKRSKGFTSEEYRRAITRSHRKD
jgi:hypothetical protein